MCHSEQCPATTGRVLWEWGFSFPGCLSGRDANRHGSSLADLAVLPSSLVTLTVPVRPAMESDSLGCSTTRVCPGCQATPG